VNLVGVHPVWVKLIAQAGNIDATSQIDASYWERGFDPGEGGHPMQFLEPLHVLPLGGPEPSATRELEAHRAADGMHRLHIMPNEHDAYLEQGQDSWPYEIEVPCACADAPLLFERHETTFVNYLRMSLHWAGFPGWERMPVRPERNITTLTAGLPPF